MQRHIPHYPLQPRLQSPGDEVVSSCEGVPPPGTYLGQKKVSAKFFFWITPAEPLQTQNQNSKTLKKEKGNLRIK